MRDSFVFYRSFAEAIRELDPEDRVLLIDILIDYALDDKQPECSGAVKGMFLLIKPQIDANNKRYDNGRKGGRPKTKQKPNENQIETKADPNVNDNVNVNVNVNDNVNDNDNVLERDAVVEKRLSQLREKISKAKGGRA